MHLDFIFLFSHGNLSYQAFSQMGSWDENRRRKKTCAKLKPLPRCGRNVFISSTPSTPPLSSLVTFPKGNLISPLHESRYLPFILRACLPFPEHLFRAPCPKRDRFKLNRLLLNLSNSIYPTPSISTTPVTLQQPPGSDLFSLIFFPFSHFSLLLPRDIVSLSIYQPFIGM
jgi:hypothetical protein